MVVLANTKLFETDQLEHGEKRDHNLGATRGIGEAFLKTHGNAMIDDLKQKVDLVGYGEILLENLAKIFLSLAALQPPERLLKRIDQIKDPDFADEKVAHRCELRIGGKSGEELFLDGFA